MRKRRGDRHVRQEYMCSFGETDYMVFSRELVRRARELGKGYTPLLAEVEMDESTEQELVFRRRSASRVRPGTRSSPAARYAAPTRAN